MNCPVCGHTDGACKGEEREIVTVSGVVKAGGPMRVPKQNVRVGRAGYQGNVEVYDPKFPKIRMVRLDPELEISDAASNPAPLLSATAAAEATVPAVASKPAPKKRAKAKE